MRLAPAIGLAALVEAALFAQLSQLPHSVEGALRHAPSLETLTRGTPPLTTGFDDTLGLVPLPGGPSWRTAHRLTELARTPQGGFVLRPGLWEGTLDSYCLTAASYAPGAGDGYLYAPLKGSRQDVIETILHGAAGHPDIPQGKMQMLLWGILARVKIAALSPDLRGVAHALLTADQIRSLDGNALALIPPSERAHLLAGLPSPVRKTIEIEADLRERLQRASSSYSDIEHVAVLAGAAPPVTGPHVARGQWSRSPSGFFIRYFPSGYSQTRVQVLVPEPVRVRRDRLNRIILIEDARGGRTEAQYDDGIAPRVPQDPALRAYAFKSLRIVTPQKSGPPLVHELHDRGWTFVRSKPPARPAGVTPAAMTRRYDVTRVVWQESGSRFDAWRERYEQAQEVHERYDYYRERYERLTERPTEDSVNRLEDMEHYRDGVNAAVGDDYGEQLDWIRDNQERQNAALEYGTSLIDSLPATSTADDVPVIDIPSTPPSPGTWDPATGAAVPAGRGRQRLGLSGRGR